MTTNTKTSSEDDSDDEDEENEEFEIESGKVIKAWRLLYARRSAELMLRPPPCARPSLPRPTRGILLALGRIAFGHDLVDDLRGGSSASALDGITLPARRQIVHCCLGVAGLSRRRRCGKRC